MTKKEYCDFIDKYFGKTDKIFKVRPKKLINRLIERY